MTDKPINYLDILNGASPSPLQPDAGAAIVVPAPVPIVQSPAVERFRSLVGDMHNTANASIAQEIERIIALPIIPEPTEEEILMISRYYCPDGKITFWPEQVKAIMQYYEYGCLIAPMAVGGGKTLASVMIANIAYSVHGKRKILLMNPPHLVTQLSERELPFYRRHISINVPFHYLAGKTPGKRMLLAKSNKAGCYVVSYSLLSGRKGAELLDTVQPDLIIGDEIHKIASASTSARGRRFKAAVTKYLPRIVGLSGTLTKKSLKEYHFLVSKALRELSFIPRPTAIAEEWAKLLDSNASSLDEVPNNANIQPGPINPLMHWARREFPNDVDKEGQTLYKNNLVGFRLAFGKRLRTCPGVVASDGDALGVSLRISNLHITKEEKESSIGWQELERLVTQLLAEWVAPNGDEIEHAMHLWKWRYELEGFGFYNNLFWPTPEKLAIRKGLTIASATDLLERSIAHHKLHQEYMKVLRHWITRNARKSLDTPFLIASSMYHHGSQEVGLPLYNAWSEMKAAEFPGMIKRDKSVVRVCDFRVRKIVEWAQQWHRDYPNKGAIMWYCNNGVAEWLKESFEQAGLPTLYCPRGKAGLANIEDRSKKGMFAIASLQSYHEGLNLQYHHSAEFFAQWPRSSVWAEQGMGRVHRPGQAEDEARIWKSSCGEFDDVLFAACLNDAAYAHQTTNKQKLLYADYDERPKVLPFAVLQEWGTQPQQLDDSKQQLIMDIFKGR